MPFDGPMTIPSPAVRLPPMIAAMSAPVEALQRSPLFSGVPAKNLKQLAGGLREIRASAGDEITTEGERGIAFFVIGEGEAKVIHEGQDVRTLGPGEFFGEIALIDGGQRTATVRAESDLVVYGTTAWEFKPFVAKNPDVAWTLL